MLSMFPKEIDFHTYCPKCARYETTDDEELWKCDQCLAEPEGADTRKPLYFKEEA